MMVLIVILGSNFQDRRYSIYKSTKDDITKLLDDLEQGPNTSFEKDIVYEEDETFLLTSENMKALKLYHDEVRFHYLCNDFFLI